MVTEAQKTRGTHIMLERGDYLLLCGLAALKDRGLILDIDERGHRMICRGYEIKNLDTGEMFMKCKDGE